jgi:preprotein translocase SecE subunit
MARDRQRSKARKRARAAGQQPRGKRSRSRDSMTPPELEGATPYVDEAHLAEQGAEIPPADDDATEVGITDDELEITDDELARAADEVEIPPDLVRDVPRRGMPAEAHPGAAEPKERGRVITFLRACVDELRRVQWPDRKHVFQATAVVLGFVLIAGGWLGLMDAIWQPLINAIL